MVWLKPKYPVSGFVVSCGRKEWEATGARQRVLGHMVTEDLEVMPETRIRASTAFTALNRFIVLNTN
jgi:hypothetical protein